MRTRSYHYPILGILAVLATAPAAAQQKPTLQPADYARWESIGTNAMSDDGRWFAYTISRVDQDGDLRYRSLADDSTAVVENGTRPVFSPDGNWLAYGIQLPEKEREKLEKASKPVRSKAAIVDLRTRETTVVNDVASFEFSGDGRYLAMRGYAPAGRGDNAGSGIDLIVRDLATGVHTSFGNVGEWAWQDERALLAMTVDAANRAGNGVRLYDARGGVIRTLESDTAEYKGLVWRDDSADLAVLKVQPDSLYDDPAHLVISWRGVDAQRGTRTEFDPSTRTMFPAAHRVVEMRSLSWSEDGSTLYFGVKEWTPKPVKAEADSTAGSSAADTAGVEVWHAGDVDIIPEQKVRAGQERNRNYLAAWHLDDDRFVQLASEEMEDVSLSDGRYALGMDGKPYERERMFGPVYRDLYVVDTHTGERNRIAERVQFQYGTSPSGRYVLYVRDGDYWTYDRETDRHTNITAGVATSFVNLDNDHTVSEKPMYGTGGWTTGERTVLLYDKYDIWEVRADGSRATNLTQGAAEQVRHRRAWLSPDDRVVDMSKPVYVTLYGERTKQYGYGRLRQGAPAERLVFLDKSVTRLGKAEDADVYYYRVEGFDDSPDFFIGSPRLADAVQLTTTNPFQADYAWGRSELIDYTSATGRDLQAALLYPADYVPGRTYPMVVYFYEITSNTVHSYSVPSERSAYNPTVFTQNGYFVLRPDIVYRDRNPGLSAVEALVPAVERAVATGMIDSERVGIVGHSWGAYQTAFAITQTDMFKAAVAGAPLTNLISMYLSIYWNSGGTDARIFEISQGRMEVPFWQDTDSYIANSPVFHIEQMNTPLLVAFGTEDGAVEFNQGVELYNAARRADKDMVMLVYEGENHSLSKEPNQLDYHRRIMQWFGHYLKDEPAPAWITTGVRHLAREQELKRIRAGAR